MGSLVSALASYLDARAHQGSWLVRIEDIDPPREMPGAADLILRCLDDHGLHWDESVLYQSHRAEAYEATLAHLESLQVLYPCNCTRQDLAKMGRIYNGHCRHQPIKPEPPAALRVMLLDFPAHSSGIPPVAITYFEDIFQGIQQENLIETGGDPILKRKDGLYAYPLAVVVDDAEQKITHVIRGMDLLEVTARQVFLFGLLNQATPLYGHVPLITFADGLKLSKQNRAPALIAAKAHENLWQALEYLGQNPPIELQREPIEQILQWATTHWDRSKVCGQSRVYTNNTDQPSNQHLFSNEPEL